jgi:hypothetical protein
VELNVKIVPQGNWDVSGLDGRVQVQKSSAHQGMADVLQISFVGRAGLRPPPWPRSEGSESGCLGQGFVMSTRMKQAMAALPPSLSGMG